MESAEPAKDRINISVRMKQIMVDEVKDNVIETETEAKEEAGTDGMAAVPVEEVATGAEEAVAAADSIVETTAVEPEIDQVAPEVAALKDAQAEAARNLDGWQRAAAELANYKRRQEEQAARLRSDIKVRILREALPVLDDFDLAFQNLPEELNEQEQKWIDGFQLILRKLTKLLDDQGVEEIDGSGQFDPALHEAVTHEESDDHDEGQIIAELRKGYRLGDRILRPALVRVAR
jgi:molecular chaperone GrpE